jgi:uncharacterized protein with ATP-grasp and redox domains
LGVEKVKLFLDCIPLKQAFNALEMLGIDGKEKEDVIKKILEVISNFKFYKKNYLLYADIQKIIKKIAPKNDPYKKIKESFNKMCLGITSDLIGMIKDSNESFETSLRIALAGNIIDIMQGNELSEEIVRKAINEALNQNIDKNKIRLLRENISNSKKILYIGDNAGEIVFDKIFIQQFLNDKVTFVVRGGPTLNDVTLEDADAVGMTDHVKVITTGLDMPGAFLPICSKEFLDEYEKSDLIIAKGQGNLEALIDEKKNIFFLLKIKCKVIAGVFNHKYKVGDIVVENIIQ